MVQCEVFVNKNFASIRSLYFNNMNSIIHRVVNFQKTGRNSISVQDLAADETNVYLLISCMDKRIIPNGFTKVPIGHLYAVRNAGNFVPTYEHYNDTESSREAGAIVLAMDYLAKLYQPDSEDFKSTGPSSKWVQKYDRPNSRWRPKMVAPTIDQIGG